MREPPSAPPGGALGPPNTSTTASASSQLPNENNNNNEASEADLYGACRPVKSFTKLNQIGEGAYGTVYRGIDKATGRMVALKRVILHNEKQDGFPLTSLREIRMLKLIGRHPNCVRLEEIAVGRKRDGVFLVFEYCEVSKLIYEVL
jgi:serine/threonine protein kinase